MACFYKWFVLYVYFGSKGLLRPTNSYVVNMHRFIKINCLSIAHTKEINYDQKCLTVAISFWFSTLLDLRKAISFEYVHQSFQRGHLNFCISFIPINGNPWSSAIVVSC